MQRYLTRESTCIRACTQPALALAFAKERELSISHLLSGTGLKESSFYDDALYISPSQFLMLLHNLQRSANDEELPFILGPQWLPGHYGHISHLLMLAPNLRQALELLMRWPLLLCPLLSPRLTLDAQGATIYWIDAWGAPAQHAFLTNMHMSAIASMTRWLSGDHLPWQFHFNRTQPRDTAAYEVYLGSTLQFGALRDCLHIPAQWLNKPWPRGNATAMALTLPQALAQQSQFDNLHSLLSTLFTYLLKHLQDSPSLDSCAQWLGISSATLKRHLAQHGTHFQAELDQARAHMALDLLLSHRLDNEAIAARLGFHDGNNFRRAFKRWTGMTPSQLAC